MNRRHLSTLLGVVATMSVCCAWLWPNASPAQESARGAPGAARTEHKGITAELDCSACHSQESWKQLAGLSAKSGGFDHGRTGFPLTGQHALAGCTDCHQADRTITRDCSGCHQDAHGRRLGQNCGGCHSSRGWFDTRAIARHRMSRLPLTGVHALLDCSECHQRTATASGEFQWVPSDCYSCHSDQYRSPNIHPSHLGVPGDPTQPPFPRDCALCHRANGWIPAFVETTFFGTRFNSASSALRVEIRHDAAFVISRGPHRDAQCGDCHFSTTRPAAVTCGGCHAHNSVALTKQHPGVLLGAAAQGGRCLSCHPGGSRR